jgi:hypothetical protein
MDAKAQQALIASLKLIKELKELIICTCHHLLTHHQLFPEPHPPFYQLTAS